MYNNLNDCPFCGKQQSAPRTALILEDDCMFLRIYCPVCKIYKQVPLSSGLSFYSVVETMEQVAKEWDKRG